MATDSSWLNLNVTLFLFVAFTLTLHTNGEIGGTSRRFLMSIRETSRESNTTFDCSPSGPCVPCQYSEKSDEKYRCSETGYRIPLKCVELKDVPDVPKGKIPRRSSLEISAKSVKLHTVLRNLEELRTSSGHRRLLVNDDSTKRENREHAYITYRSCIQTVSEEKLSVIGFEGLVFWLLVGSGLLVYVRKKRATSPSGFVRVQSNSRF